MKITPIQTRYAGCHFRSRLEARWARAFDTAGIEWQYEPEGFETPHGRYLPDFRIPIAWPRGAHLAEWMWVEVKHEDYAVSPTEQAQYLAVAQGTGYPLAAVFGLDSGAIVVLPTGEATATKGVFHPQIGDEALRAAKSARFQYGRDD